MSFRMTLYPGIFSPWKVPFFFLSLLLLPWLASSQALAAERVRVTWVIDGDTIRLANGQKVRYLGIDAPEMEKNGQPEYLAPEATDYNRRLVLDKEVFLEYGPERGDHYNRVLAYVFLGNGLFINGELVKKGLAHVLYHGPWMERFEALLQLQREAMQDSRGIWAKMLKETENGYRGQKRSLRFHRLSCPLGKKISPQNLVLLTSKKEAFGHGYSPCRNCQP